MPPLDRGELLTQSEILDKQTSSRAQQANHRPKQRLTKRNMAEVITERW